MAVTVPHLFTGAFAPLTPDREDNGFASRIEERGKGFSSLVSQGASLRDKQEKERQQGQIQFLTSMLKALHANPLKESDPMEAVRIMNSLYEETKQKNQLDGVLEKLLETLGQTNVVTAFGLVGKTGVFRGDQLHVGDGLHEEGFYEVPEGLSPRQVEIAFFNASGSRVAEHAGFTSTGRHSLKEILETLNLEEGTYSFVAHAHGEQGPPVELESFVSSKITGIQEGQERILVQGEASHWDLRALRGVSAVPAGSDK